MEFRSEQSVVVLRETSCPLSLR